MNSPVSDQVVGDVILTLLMGAGQVLMPSTFIPCQSLGFTCGSSVVRLC